MAVKTYVINGMTCGHCSTKVEQAINAINGVTAHVDLDAKTATVTSKAYIDDAQIVNAITNAGYTVVENCI